MDEAADIAGRLEACFREIEARRMAGVPILNPALGVKAVGMRPWREHWLCALVTPWFMNLMLLPSATGAESVRAGVKQVFVFPAGRFEFIRGEESAIGPYWMCSLFSPVLEFADQESAETAAAAALEALLGDGEEESEAERDMAMVWRGELPQDAPAAGGAQRTANDGETAGGGKPVPAASNPDAPSGYGRRAFLTGRAHSGEGT
jgi:[NiFe] hydrogenase assembly HybE family chaperone